jgi:tRNA(Ile)-lysidine synthetase-like protein
MRTTGGGKSLKKLFLEYRIPRSLRARLPVLADAGGEVLWVGAVPRRPVRRPRPGEDALVLSVVDA